MNEWIINGLTIEQVLEKKNEYHDLLNFLDRKNETDEKITFQEVLAYIDNNTNIDENAGTRDILNRFADVEKGDVSIKEVKKLVMQFMDTDLGVRDCGLNGNLVPLNACFFGCNFGHQSFCHYPNTCDEERCSKYIDGLMEMIGEWSYYSEQGEHFKEIMNILNDLVYNIGIGSMPLQRLLTSNFKIPDDDPDKDKKLQKFISDFKDFKENIKKMDQDIVNRLMRYSVDFIDIMVLVSKFHDAPKDDWEEGLKTIESIYRDLTGIEGNIFT